MTFHLNPLFFALSAGGSAGEGGNAAGPYSWISTIVMLVLVVVVFYFFIIRPQKKQEKETANMRNSLEVGDEITTIGGIIGRIISIKDETVLIETSKDKTKIRLLKSAVKTVDVKAADAQK